MTADRRRAIAVAATVAALVAIPSPAAAHAIEGAYQLPVPLSLYLLGAAVAVGASFVVTARAARRATPPAYPTRPVPAALSGVARAVLRILGLLWWYGAILVGFVVGDISPLPAVLLWVLVWVGLPMTAALLGNSWPSLSPFRTTHAALEWVGRRIGLARLDAGLPYPPGLARWPAVVLLASAIWAELVLPGSAVAGTVSALMLGYTLLTLIGMTAVGPIAWLRHAELFEVLLGWFGRIGPIGRRSVSAELCDGCGEACDPGRCVDCPECSVVAEDGERRAELRPWFAGLTEPMRAGWSDAAFIVLALAGVTFDGLRSTAFGGVLLDLVLNPLTGALGVTATAFLLADTVTFALVVAAFLAAFALIVRLTRSLAAGGAAVAPGAYASTLLPIAAGYLIAHYLTLVLRGVIWLPGLLLDPLMNLAPDMSWVPAGVVWYLSVGAIVGGHVAGIWLAHRLALRDAPERATVAGLPMVALMIGYTVLSLWIIAQPIVIEPGVVPAAFR
jgi:hypothetical protein